MLSERQRKFAQLYAQLGNATQAAIQAGYSPGAGAATQGSRLLRNAEVQKILVGNRVNREVHAEQTYNELIQVKNVALKLVADAMRGGEYDLRYRVLAVEAAGKALERLAKCEGLMIERKEVAGEIRVNLQDLVQRAREMGASEGRPAIAHQVDAVFKPESGNGNGHAAGEAKAS